MVDVLPQAELVAVPNVGHAPTLMAAGAIVAPSNAAAARLALRAVR